MSAYAVPGYLFPPLPRSSLDKIAAHSHSSTNMSIRDFPGEEKLDSDSGVRRCSLSQSGGVRITVQDCKIDACHLIQSFLAFSSSNESAALRSKPHTRRRRPQGSWSSTSVKQSTLGASPMLDSPDGAKKGMEESCMMFTLRMVLGSTAAAAEDAPERDAAPPPRNPVTVTRTLAQIRQLCTDILTEQREQEEDATIRMDRGPIQSSAMPDILLPPHAPAIAQNRPSFTYWQEQIRSYVPVLNQWFQQLGQRIPLLRSAVFMQFMDTAEAPRVLGGGHGWTTTTTFLVDGDSKEKRVSLRRPPWGATRRIDSMESIDEGPWEDDEID